MFELRILSGLHRGAALPLDENPHSIGASDDADVVLVDDTIAERHATLSRNGSGWVLTAEEGMLYPEDANTHSRALDIMPGSFARVGDVWITVVSSDAPWEGHPSFPEDEEINQVDVQAEVSAESIYPAVPSRRPMHTRRYVLAAAAATIVFSAAAAYAISAKPGSEARTTHDTLPREERLAESTQSVPPLPNSVNSTAAAAKPLTHESLRDAFRKRLSEAELLDLFEMDLGDTAWSMKAVLSDEEAARFEHILDEFKRKNHISFPVSAKRVSPEEMLPFSIKQVLSGDNASAVTQEGHRMYVGEEFKGVRLVAIADNHLVFAAKRKIEIDF